MIRIGRHLEGITLNPLEYVLDAPDGNVMEFETKEKAIEFLRENGEDGTDEEIEDMYVFEEVEQQKEKA